ncbi:MAG: bifunctional nuclease family protein [Candidatus Omnitrophota bacterium]|nr:bifunctional nuclease family protein [Candidatus Omnitrophota bacterium]
MIEMELNKIIIDEKRQDQVIVLKEKNGIKTLPIVIGLLEASSIKMKLSGIQAPRPLTHDLLYSIIESLKVKVEKIVIDKLENNTFYAKMFIAAENQETRIIDARPSDSIALAVRAKAPIFVEEEVLEQSAKYK